jgi:ketosteroid isomerase-like protein
MSEENEALVVRVLEAWNRRDYAEAQSGFSPDVEIEVALEATMDGTYSGYEGLRGLMKFWGAFGEFRSDIEEIRSSGDRVFIEAHHHARGKTSGIDVEMTNWQVFTLRDGAIIRHAMYASREEALEAAGLSE